MNPTRRPAMHRRTELSPIESRQPTETALLPGADDIYRQVLPNGITVLARANFQSPSVALQGSLHIGSLHDPADKLGLADFTASMLTRGTASRTHFEIYDCLETVGASLGVSAGTHTGGFSGRALAEDLELLLELAAETLREPLFPPDELERLRAQILTGLALRSENPEAMAGLRFDELVYPGHPYSRPEEGWPETVSAIHRQDLIAFHQTYYGPHNMNIVVVGGLAPEDMIARVSAAFSDWENPRQPPPRALPDVEPIDDLRRSHLYIPGKSQTALVMGAAGPARKTPGFLAAVLGNHVLGQFGMYGRLGESLREKSGLAYYAYSALSGGIGPGPWAIAAGLDPADLERAIQLIRAEIRRFVEQGVSSQELADSQANLIGGLPLSLESNAGVATALANLLRYDLDLDYYRTYAARIRAVTVEEVLEIARQYLHPDRLAIATAGPGESEGC